MSPHPIFANLYLPQLRGNYTRRQSERKNEVYFLAVQQVAEDGREESKLQRQQKNRLVLYIFFHK
jgi:hypothetical protein